MPSCQRRPESAGGGTRKWSPRTRPQLSHQPQPGVSCWRATLPLRPTEVAGGGCAAPPPHPTDPRGLGAQAPPALLSHVAARDGLSVAASPLTANPKAGDHNNAMGGVGEGRKRAVTGITGWGWGPGWGNCGAQTPPCQADQAAEDLECLKWGGGEGYPKTERDTWLAGGWGWGEGLPVVPGHWDAGGEGIKHQGRHQAKNPTVCMGFFFFFLEGTKKSVLLRQVCIYDAENF